MTWRDVNSYYCDWRVCDDDVEMVEKLCWRLREIVTNGDILTRCPNDIACIRGCGWDRGWWRGRSHAFCCIPFWRDFLIRLHAFFGLMRRPCEILCFGCTIYKWDISLGELMPFWVVTSFVYKVSCFLVVKRYLDEISCFLATKFPFVWWCML